MVKKLFPGTGLLIIVFLILPLSSCMTTSTRSRGSLSGAMDAARDGEDHRVPDEPKPEEEEEENWWEEDEGDDGREETPSRSVRDESSSESSDTMATGDLNPMVIARGGPVPISESYFDTAWHGELLLGAGENHGEFYVFGNFMPMSPQSDHSVSDSVKDNVLFLSAGLEGRLYPFASLKYFSPYVMGRIGGLFLSWSFLNPLTAGNDTIHSDSVGGLVLGTGLGIDLIRGETFRFGGQVMPEAYLFSDETSQGFTNDYFSSMGLIRWGLEAGFTF